MGRRGYAASTIDELFRARTEPLDGGHLRWTGYTSKRGVGSVRHGGRIHTAARVAFRIHHGRDPQGYCTAECGMPGCVAPEHIDDDTTRTRNRAVYAVLIGLESPADECRRGHAAPEHRRYARDGRPYCAACNALADKGES